MNSSVSENGVGFARYTRANHPEPILDSMLISATNLKKYDIKIIDCGDYVQAYYYQNSKFLSNKDDDLDLKKVVSDIKSDISNNNLNSNNENNITINNLDTEKEQKIENRNIIRSKLSCQRLAKANSKIWKTFITLTFEENVNNIKTANKKFHNFTRQIQRVKKDFSYIAIPEFQKRGAVHYHLLSNISINDSTLIYAQEDNPKFKHIKYWKQGFTSVETLKGDIKKIVGYISKYMTKEADNRLFGHRRYMYSNNLFIPKASYIDSSNKIDNDFYIKKIQDKDLIYRNEYINPYDNSKVIFLEFSTSNNNIIT